MGVWAGLGLLLAVGEQDTVVARAARLGEPAPVGALLQVPGLLAPGDAELLHTRSVTHFAGEHYLK